MKQTKKMRQKHAEMRYLLSSPNNQLRHVPGQVPSRVSSQPILKRYEADSPVTLAIPMNTAPPRVP